MRVLKAGKNEVAMQIYLAVELFGTVRFFADIGDFTAVGAEFSLDYAVILHCENFRVVKP